VAAETKIIISNIPPYDGEYELDLDQALSTREWRWVKQISEGGIKLGQLDEDALADPDFVVALAVIAMHRANKIPREKVLEVADTIADAPLDDAHISLVAPSEEEEEVPPASAIEPERSSPKSSIASDNSTKPSSVIAGTSLRNDSDLSGESLAPTGTSR